MTWIIRFSLICGLLLTLTNCGGGGNSYPTGKVCPSASYNPIPVDIPNNPNSKANPEKVELDPDKGELLNYPGEYVYQGMDIVYANKLTGTVYHMVDQKNAATKEWSQHVYCAKNFRPNTEFQFDLTALSGMVVDPISGETISNDVRIAKVDFHREHLALFNVSLSSDAPQKPTDPANKPGVTSFFYKMAPNEKVPVTFQVRYAWQKSAEETVYFRVFLKRTPPSYELE